MNYLFKAHVKQVGPAAGREQRLCPLGPLPLPAHTVTPCPQATTATDKEGPHVLHHK